MIATLFLIAVTVFSLAGILFSLWALHCNNVCYEQRGVIIETVFAQPNWVFFREVYSVVTYDKHFRALLWGRDPMSLYDRRLRELL